MKKSKKKVTKKTTKKATKKTAAKSTKKAVKKITKKTTKKITKKTNKKATKKIAQKTTKKTVKKKTIKKTNRKKIVPQKTKKVISIKSKEKKKEKVTLTAIPKKVVPILHLKKRTTSEGRTSQAQDITSSPHHSLQAGKNTPYTTQMQYEEFDGPEEQTYVDEIVHHEEKKTFTQPPLEQDEDDDTEYTHGWNYDTGLDDPETVDDFEYDEEDEDQLYTRQIQKSFISESD